jgi:hypothetical protein
MLSVVMSSVVTLNVVASDYDNLTTMNFTVKLKTTKTSAWVNVINFFVSNLQIFIII